MSAIELRALLAKPHFIFASIVCMSFMAMAIALVMQYTFAMEPCPLCISQRIFIVLAGTAALVGLCLCKMRWGILIFSALTVVSSAIGASIAARHVWIQNLPEDEVPICGPGLGYMFETRPFFDAVNLLFSGDGHCAEVNFTLFGLSIPGWTLLLFLFFIASSAWLFFSAIFKVSKD